MAIQRDEILVYDNNGVVGDNFQAYYLEQDPNFVLYQSTYNADGSVRALGSPVSGLTNQQNWSQYGIEPVAGGACQVNLCGVI